jgi:hypothetical protein
MSGKYAISCFGGSEEGVLKDIFAAGLKGREVVMGRTGQTREVLRKLILETKGFVAL